MKALIINDIVGAHIIGLHRTQIDHISYEGRLVCDISSIPPVATYSETTNYDIITINIHNINCKTIQYYDSFILKHTPDMIIITSPNPAYITLPEHHKFKKVIEYIEETWNYILAGLPKNHTFDMHTFMVDPSDFGSNITEGNTYIIGYHKDKFMPHSNTIRKAKLPKTNNRAFPTPLREKLTLPYHRPWLYLTQKQANHLKTQQAEYMIINNETFIPALTIDEMLDKDEYTLVQDDSWQVQQVNQTKVNKEGYRFPHPALYRRLRGYETYACMDTEGVDGYALSGYIPKAFPPDYYVHSLDLHPLLFIFDKYVNKLRELTRRI